MLDTHATKILSNQQQIPTAQENSSTTSPLPKALATAGESRQLVATSVLQKLEPNLENQHHLIAQCFQRSI